MVAGQSTGQREHQRGKQQRLFAGRLRRGGRPRRRRSDVAIAVASHVAATPTMRLPSVAAGNHWVFEIKWFEKKTITFNQDRSVSGIN